MIRHCKIEDWGSLVSILDYEYDEGGKYVPSTWVCLTSEFQRVRDDVVIVCKSKKLYANASGYVEVDQMIYVSIVTIDFVPYRLLKLILNFLQLRPAAQLHLD